MSADKDIVRNNFDFSEVCQPLSEIVSSANVPLVCVLLADGCRTYRRTFFGTESMSSSRPYCAGQERSNKANHVAGIPRALREAKTDEADELGGSTMFAIASLAKPLLALTYCIMIHKQVIKKPTLDTEVMGWIRELYGNSTPISKLDLPEKLSVQDLLLHKNVLPPLPRFLWLADGIFQITDEDFIRYLAAAVGSDGRKEVFYQYSNANIILMAILLEKQMGCKVDKILEEHLFKPLGMNRTNLDGNEKTTQSRKCNVASGQRLFSDLTTCIAVPKQPYRDSTAYKMSIGMWSCADDLAKLFRAIVRAMNGQEDYITSSIAKDFFHKHIAEADGSPRIGMSFAGLIYPFRAPSQGHESLNCAVLQKKKQPERARSFSTPVSVENLSVYYKSGTCDGFTCTVYLHPPTGKFAIVLSNASGPVDVTEPIARYLLETSIAFEYGHDSTVIRQGLQVAMKKQLAVAVDLWRKIEEKDGEYLNWSDDLRPFIGVYQHGNHKLQMEITEGEAVFSRRRNESNEHITTMKIGVSGKTLRLFPIHQGVFVDRLTTFEDLTYDMVDVDGNIRLSANGKKDVFIKL